MLMKLTSPTSLILLTAPSLTFLHIAKATKETFETFKVILELVNMKGQDQGKARARRIWYATKESSKFLADSPTRIKSSK